MEAKIKLKLRGAEARSLLRSLAEQKSQPRDETGFVRRTIARHMPKGGIHGAIRK